MTVDFAIDLTIAPRNRTVINVQGITIIGVGNYEYITYYKNNATHKMDEVGRYPLEIVFQLGATPQQQLAPIH